MKHEYLLFGLAFNKQTIEQATAKPVFSPNSSGKKNNSYNTAQIMKSSIKYFFRKCGQNLSLLRI